MALLLSYTRFVFYTKLQIFLREIIAISKNNRTFAYESR